MEFPLKGRVIISLTINKNREFYIYTYIYYL